MELSWPSSEGLFEKQLNNLPCSVFNTSKNVATTSRPIPAKKAVQEKPQCQPCRKKLPSKYYTKLYNKIWQEMEDMMEEEKRLSMMLDSQSFEQNSPRLRKSQQSVSSCLIQSSQRCQDVNGGNGLNLKQNRCKGVPLDNRANQSVSSCLIQNRCKSVPLDNGKCCICKPVYCSCNPVKCTCKPGKIRDSGGNFAGEIRDSGENFAGEIRDSGGNFAGKIRDSGGNFAGEIRDSERNFAGEIRDSKGNFAASCSKEKKGEQKNVLDKQQRVRNRNRNYLKEGEEAGVLEENRKKDWLREGREDKKGEIAGKQQVLKNRDKDEEQEKRMEEEDKEEEEEEYFWCGASLYVFVEEVDSRKRANTREMMAHKVKSNRRHINRMKEYLRMITGDPVELEEDEKGGEQEIEVEKIDVENWLKQVSPESQVDAWVSTVVAEDCLDCIFPLPQWKRYEWDSNDIDDSSDYEEENWVSGTQFRNNTFSKNCSNKAQGSGGNDVVNSSTQGSDSENYKKIYGNIVGSSAQDSNLKSAQNFGGKDVINSSTQDKVSKDSRNPDGKDLINSSKQGSDSKSTQHFGGNDVVNSSVHVCSSKNSGGNNVINSILQDSESKRARNSCGNVVNPSKNGSNSKNSNSNVVEIHESSSTGSFYLEISCGEVSTSDKNVVKNLKCSSSEGDCFSDNAQWLENSQNSSSIEPDIRGGNFRKKLDKICGNLRKSSENLGGRFCRSKVDAVDEDDTDSTNFEEKIEELTGNRISSCDSTENQGNSSHNNRALSGKRGDSVCKAAAGSRKPQRNYCDGTNKNVVTTNNNLVGNLQKNLVKNNKSLAVNLEKTGEAIPNLLVLKVGSQEVKKLKNVLVDNNFREINAQTISRTTENLRNSHDEFFDNSFDMFLDSIDDQLTENRQKSVEEKFVENSNEMSQEKYKNHRNSVNENNVDKCNEIPMKKIEKSTQNHRNSVDEIFVDNSSGIVMKKIDKSKQNSSEKDVEDNPNAKNMANTRKSFEKSSGGDVENCVTSEKNCKSTVENFKSFGHSVRNCVVILEKLEICLDSRIGNRTTRKVIEASCQNSDKKRKSCVLDENLCTNDENFVKKRCMASENDTSNGNQKLMENSGKNDLQHNPKKLLQSKSRLLVKNVSENLGDGFKDGQLKKKLRICIETPKIAGRKSLEEIEHEMKVFYGILKDSNQKQVVCDNVKKSKQKQLISDIVEKSNEKQQKICDHLIKSDRKQLICYSVDETKKKQLISHSVDKSNQKQLNSDNAEKSNVKQHNICDHTKNSDKKQMTSDSVEKSNQKQLIVNRPGISGEDQLISGSKQDYSYSIPSITKHISTKIIIDNSLSITATSGDVKTNYIRLKDKLAADENDFSAKNPKSSLGADQTRRVKHPLSLTKRLRKSTSTLTNSNRQLINECNDSGLDVEIEIVKRKVKKMFGIITEIRPPLQDDNAKDAIVWNCGRCKKFYNYTQVKFKFPELNLVAECPKKCRQANGTKHLKGQLMFEFLIENILDEKVYSYLLANNEAESFFGCSAFAYWSRDTVRVELRQCIERLLIGRQKGLISNFFVDENAFDEQGRQFIVNVVRMREKSSETN
ncbi:uncharacterized protein LOC111053965 isoform X2 [Nilaparvata lugens]|uniref:uncharacterized protein LOC111053965 isoform X2 n=1 Tax=Nilaparvata lugens TaxID=108931 RepID=UPI00193D9F8C|nr:uncharacterized protein LOC111053965 isoform X2 [Nilaparvata lugens]